MQLINIKNYNSTYITLYVFLCTKNVWWYKIILLNKKKLFNFLYDQLQHTISSQHKNNKIKVFVTWGWSVKCLMIRYSIGGEMNWLLHS